MAALAHARGLGVQARIENSPADISEPFVIGYTTSTPESTAGVILLFPPVDVYLNSTALSYITSILRNAEVEGRAATLVFHDETLRSVRNVLNAAGIPMHASIQSYVMNRDSNLQAAGIAKYVMSWGLPQTLPGTNLPTVSLPHLQSES